MTNASQSPPHSPPQSEEGGGFESSSNDDDDYDEAEDASDNGFKNKEPENVDSKIMRKIRRRISPVISS